MLPKDSYKTRTKRRFIKKILIPLFILLLFIHEGHAFEEVDSLNVNAIRFYNIYPNRDYSLWDNKTDFSDYYVRNADATFFEPLMLSLVMNLRFNEDAHRNILRYLESDPRIDKNSLDESNSQISFKYKDQPYFEYEANPWGLLVDYTYKEPGGEPKAISIEELKKVKSQFFNESKKKILEANSNDTNKRPLFDLLHLEYGGNGVTMVYTSDRKIMNISADIWKIDSSHYYRNFSIDNTTVLFYNQEWPMGGDILFIGGYPAGYIRATFGFLFLNEYYKRSVEDESTQFTETKKELNRSKTKLQNKNSEFDFWAVVENLTYLGISLQDQEERMNKLNSIKKINELITERSNGTWVKEVFWYYISGNSPETNLNYQEMQREIKTLKEFKKDLFEIALVFNQNINFNKTLKEMEEQNRTTWRSSIAGAIIGGIIGGIIGIIGTIAGILVRIRKDNSLKQKQNERDEINKNTIFGVIFGVIVTYMAHILLRKKKDGFS